MENYYSVQLEAAQRQRDLQVEADAHRISRQRDLNVDTHQVRRYSHYLGRILAGR